MAFDEMGRRYYEHDGIRFRVPTMQDLVGLQAKIDLPEADKAFMSISDVLMWCKTPAGSLAMLDLTSMKQFKPGKMLPLEVLALAAEIIMLSMPDAQPETGEDAQEGVPLSETGSMSAT